MNVLHCGAYTLSLDRPLVMGIVNLTPDSFSGDGLGHDTQRALAHAEAQLKAGADLLDVGAESSRPGAIPPSAEEEMARLVPVLQELSRWKVPVSVDTYKPEVMSAALALGVSMINDIRGMSLPAAREIVAGSDCGICLMHMQGQPGTMQQAPVYGDVLAEVSDYLATQSELLMAMGVARERILVDPGFGFGKTFDHNAALFRGLPVLIERLSLPVLVGVSRKSMLGEIVGRPVGERLSASLAAALLAAQRGASVIRVHDVAETRDVLKVLAALNA